MASQITSLTIVFSTVYSAQIKENIKTLCPWPQRASNAGKILLFDDIIMIEMHFVMGGGLGRFGAESA